MDSILSIIASLASIIAGIWSFIEARSSKTFAKKSERILLDLTHHRKISEVAKIQAETRRIFSIISQIGPSSNLSQITGINSTEISKEAADYIAYITENSEYFTQDNSNHAIELANSVRTDIEGLAESKTPLKIKSHGKNIYYAIQKFMPIVKQLSDRNQDKIS